MLEKPVFISHPFTAFLALPCLTKHYHVQVRCTRSRRWCSHDLASAVPHISIDCLELRIHNINEQFDDLQLSTIDTRSIDIKFCRPIGSTSSEFVLLSVVLLGYSNFRTFCRNSSGRPKRKRQVTSTRKWPCFSKNDEHLQLHGNMDHPSPSAGMVRATVPATYTAPVFLTFRFAQASHLNSNLSKPMLQ